MTVQTGLIISLIMNLMLFMYVKRLEEALDDDFEDRVLLYLFNIYFNVIYLNRKIHEAGLTKDDDIFMNSKGFEQIISEDMKKFSRDENG